MRTLAKSIAWHRCMRTDACAQHCAFAVATASPTMHLAIHLQGGGGAEIMFFIWEMRGGDLTVHSMPRSALQRVSPAKRQRVIQLGEAMPVDLRQFSLPDNHNASSMNHSMSDRSRGDRNDIRRMLIEACLHACMRGVLLYGLLR